MCGTRSATTGRDDILLTVCVVVMITPFCIVSPAAAQAHQASGAEERIRRGDIVVANIGDHSVSVFDGESGAYRGPAFEPGAGGLERPTGIAFGPDGDLYVGSSGNGRILRYDGATGEPIGVFASGPPLARPFSLVFGPGGDLFVSSGPVVLRYAPDGSFVGHAAKHASLKQPIGLAFGSDALLYVVASALPGVARFDPDSGDLVDVFVSDSLAFPSDAAFGPDGDLYVSNASAYRVVRFDGETGEFREVIANLPDDGVPMGLAFHGPRLVIGDFGKGRLYFLDPAGDAGSTLGTLREVARASLRRPENLAVRSTGF